VRSTRLLTCALTWVVALAAWVPIGQANEPEPPNSTAPAFILVGGTQTPSGQPDPSLAFTITVRDFANQPVGGAWVDVNFANCSDTRLCTAVVAGQVVDCLNHTVRGTSNASGQVTLTLLGAGVNDGNTIPPAIAAGSAVGCIRVYADGVQISTATSILLDQNGALPGGNGVNGLDLAIAKNDVGASGLGAPYRGRTDYTMDGLVNGADLARLRDQVGLSGLGLGSGAGCAGGGTAQAYCP
jgi:hypothetical protein